ncbi:MAG: 5'/3'-nucleotidase SurE [Nitrospinae bacterium]|nr:5'/3'-nucleotidase SurE [Nitrospinota bacterium]
MILLTNDDGIRAPGLRALYESIKEVDEVCVVAPETEMSAVGHAITLSDPLRVKEIMKNGGFFGYAVSGTPADCVKIALKAILRKKPDMVLSGINQGANVGTNVIYSGTVSAATEGTILGIPSIAISLDSFVDTDFSAAAAFAKRLVSQIRKRAFPKGTLLNVNVPSVPADQIQGVEIVPQGKSRVVETFDKRVDPRQHTYYWQAGEMVIMEEDEGTDCWALRHKKISITPIHFDLTDYGNMDLIRGWEIGA